MTDQTEYYRWRKSVSSSYYEDEATGLEVWLEGRKPLLAEIESNRAAIGELVEVLKAAVDCGYSKIQVADMIRATIAKYNLPEK